MTDQTIISEKLLLQRYYQTENLEYLGQALQRYTPILLGVAMKYVKQIDIAEDLVQQVFLKALEKLPKQLSNLGGWLYMVLRNECMDYLRRNNTSYQFPSEEYELEIPAEDNLEEWQHWQKYTDEQKLLQLIESLKEEQQVCIRLFFLQNKSYVQISEMTGYSFNDVKSHIQNGKRNLKIKFEKEKLS